MLDVARIFPAGGSKSRPCQTVSAVALIRFERSETPYAKTRRRNYEPNERKGSFACGALSSRSWSCRSVCWKGCVLGKPHQDRARVSDLTTLFPVYVHSLPNLLHWDAYQLLHTVPTHTVNARIYDQHRRTEVGILTRVEP